jgi:hypothetical protein
MVDAVVDGAIADYERLLAERHYASTVDGLAEAHRRHGMQYPDGRRWCTVLRPGMIPRAVHDRAMAAAQVVSRAVREVTERVLVDRRLRDALGFPKYLDAALDIDRELGNASLLARLDGFIVDGEARFIEYNAEPGGMASTKEVELAFAGLPIATEFGALHRYTHFDNVVLAFDAVWRDHAQRGGERAPVLAVLRTTASMVQGPMLRWLPYAATRGFRIFVVRPEEIDIAESGIRVEGAPIDYLVFADWVSVFQPNDVMRRVLRAVAQGTVRTLNGVSRVVAGTAKVILEALTSTAYAHYFDRATVAALSAHLPWTRWLRDARTDFDGREVDLLRFAEDHRSSLVLKPSNAKGGDGLLIGADCDDATWRAALAASSRRPTVVQQWIEPPRARFPVVGADGALAYETRRWDFNPYVWNGDVAAGALIRADVAANLSKGTGSVVPVWVLE